MNAQTVKPICPLCGGTSHRPYAQFSEFTWLRCDCGLIFKQAPAAPATDIGSSGAFGEESYGQRYEAHDRRRVLKSKVQVRDALEFVSLESLQAGRRMLDIGCSLGYTLEAGRELGLTAVGVDVSAVAVERCAARGFEAHVASLESLPFPAQHFTVIVMKHVLEHTLTPRDALREARRVLHPGGALFIAVPHAGYGKAARNPRKSRFYRPDAHGGREHWVYYTPATLARLLADEGYVVKRVHPLLFHRRASAPQQLRDVLLWPLRLLSGALLGAVAARKEFWLVAVPGDARAAAD